MLDWFGRWFSPDARDSEYPLREVLPAEITIPRYQYWYSAGILNQQRTPRCVGFSGKGLLLDGPVRNLNAITPEQLYFGAQDNDEWEGRDYAGTSVRGLMSYLTALGYIAEYRWAQTMDDIRDHIAVRGPVLVGTDWPDGMSYPDSQGFIWPDDKETQMGHAYEIRGANFERGDYRMKQTWGTGWGQNGMAWLKDEVIEHLVFERNGEAAIAVEAKREE